MPGRADQKAQDVFLQSQRKGSTKIIIGDATTSTRISSEGVTLTPAKRTPEEEERIARTRQAVIGSKPELSISQRGAISSTMGGRSRHR